MYVCGSAQAVTMSPFLCVHSPARPSHLRCSLSFIGIAIVGM